MSADVGREYGDVTSNKNHTSHSRAAEAEGMRLRNESYFTAVRTIKLP